MSSVKTYQKGLGGERWCALFLMMKGYRILAKRYKTAVGEIDVIAAKRRTLVFVEVKRYNNEEAALNAITVKSQSRIRRAAEFYLVRHQESHSLYNTLRCDAVIFLPKWRVKHLKNSF